MSTQIVGGYAALLLEFANFTFKFNYNFIWDLDNRHNSKRNSNLLRIDSG